MDHEAKVVRLPVPQEKVTCHIPVPRFDAAIANGANIAHGLSLLSSAMAYVSERFDDLVGVFEEFPRATYEDCVSFIDGRLTFVFHVPRSVLPRLRELGWDEADLDVQSEGTVPSERDTSDA